ncbi:hypothetical protein HanIR_Chr15g0750031 [Helianthus annuus]|nr:hypothetical protein HanIR_Chr15g0750031 [Helianthus annuus]
MLGRRTGHVHLHIFHSMCLVYKHFFTHEWPTNLVLKFYKVYFTFLFTYIQFISLLKKRYDFPKTTLNIHFFITQYFYFIPIIRANYIRIAGRRATNYAVIPF